MFVGTSSEMSYHDIIYATDYHNAGGHDIFRLEFQITEYTDSLEVGK